MLLGLLADIHERNDLLRAALRDLEAAGVDRVVLLGDLIDLGDQLEETAELLDDPRVVGVWGNHDFGLCQPDDDALAATYSPRVRACFAKLLPRLQIEHCAFTHNEPWLDATKIYDLWFFEGPPRSPERVGRSLRAAPGDVAFMGHLHLWLLADARGASAWNGAAPTRLPEGEKFLVVVNALRDGHYALYDTATRLLTPKKLVP